jgi:hypothetical protein
VGEDLSLGADKDATDFSKERVYTESIFTEEAGLWWFIWIWWFC